MLVFIIAWHMLLLMIQWLGHFWILFWFCFIEIEILCFFSGKNCSDIFFKNIFVKLGSKFIFSFLLIINYLQPEVKLDGVGTSRLLGKPILMEDFSELNNLIWKVFQLPFHFSVVSSMSSKLWSYIAEVGSSLGSEYFSKYGWARACSAVILLSASNSSIFSNKSIATGFAPLKTSLKSRFFITFNDLM